MKAMKATIHCECPHCNFIIQATYYGNAERFDRSLEAIECRGCNNFFIIRFHKSECEIFKCDTEKHSAIALCTIKEFEISEVKA